MRGAFGKAHGTAARVKIGQILMSVRSYDKFKVGKMRKYSATIKHQFWCYHAMAVFTLWERRETHSEGWDFNLLSSSF